MVLAQRRLRARSLIIRIFASPVLFLVVLSGAFVLVQAPQNRETSPLDEYVYLDYLSKVPEQGYLRQGEETGAIARQAIACRGVMGYGTYGDSCGSTEFDSDLLYPYAGKTGADLYAPLYFWVTWAVAQPLTMTGVGLLDAGRLVGALWLSLGTCMLYGLLRSLSVPKAVAFGMSAIVVASPAIYWSAIFVSTDAPTLAVGAGVGWAAMASVKGKLPQFVLPVLSAIAVLFKIQNLAIVGIVAAALVALSISRLGDRPASWRQRARYAIRSPTLWSAVATVFAALGAQVAWLTFRANEALPVPPAQIDSVQLPLTRTALVQESVKFLLSVGASSASPTLVGLVAAPLLTALTLAAIIGILLRPRSAGVAAVMIAASTLVVALLFGPGLNLATVAIAGYYVPLPPRYGLALLPAFVACMALYLPHGRRFGWAVAVVGFLFAAVAVVT